MGLAGAFFAADLGVFNLSIQFTNIANATLFNNLAPVFVVFFGWLLFNEKVGVGVILALIVTLGGMTLFMGKGFSIHAGQTLGDGLAILTAIFYAGYLATVKSLKSRHSTSRIMGYTSAIGAAMLFPIMLLEGGALWPDTMEGWAILIALGVVCHVVGQGLVTAAMAHLTVTFTSFGLLLQPIGAACFAWAFFDERLLLLQIVGGFLVLLGIGLVRQASS